MTTRLRQYTYLPHFFFFFNDTATTEIYTLSLHDALPIFAPRAISIRPSFRRLTAGGRFAVSASAAPAGTSPFSAPSPSPESKYPPRHSACKTWSYSPTYRAVCIDVGEARSSSRVPGGR